MKRIIFNSNRLKEAAETKLAHICSKPVGQVYGLEVIQNYLTTECCD